LSIVLQRNEKKTVVLGSTPSFSYLIGDLLTEWGELIGCWNACFQVRQECKKWTKTDMFIF